MEIPHRSLSPEALRGLIEAFVTREGFECTDELPLAFKTAQVKAQLDQGRAVILYDEEDGSFTILPKDQVPKAI